MIGFLIAGLVIGFLARLIRPGRDALSLPLTLVVGVVGSLIGGTIASMIGTGDIWELNVVGFVVSVISAIVLLGIVEGVMGGRRRGPIAH